MEQEVCGSLIKVVRILEPPTYETQVFTINADMKGT
jgi:hypothetical protein